MQQQLTINNAFTTGTRSVSSMDHARIRRDPIEWPNGARVAVTWTVILELLTGPSTGPSQVYNGSDSKYSIFGGRRGIWRLLDLLDVHQIKGSFPISGYAAEKFPSAVQEVRSRGHEIAGYGYATNRYLDELPPNEEREDILKTLDILERVSGTRPIGWISPDLRPGDRTLEILAEAGIQWNGDFPNDDLPYVVQVSGSPMVIIPYGNQIDDRELYQRHRQLPSTLADNFIDSLDVLYEEGATHPKMLNVSLRAHLFGRANGKMAIDRTIRYAKSLPPPGVWITTRTEIAEWWRQRGYS